MLPNAQFDSLISNENTTVFGPIELAVVTCERDERHPFREWTASTGVAFVRFVVCKDATNALDAVNDGLVLIDGVRVRGAWAREDTHRRKQRDTRKAKSRQVVSQLPLAEQQLLESRNRTTGQTVVAQSATLPQFVLVSNGQGGFLAVPTQQLANLNTMPTLIQHPGLTLQPQMANMAQSGLALGGAPAFNFDLTGSLSTGASLLTCPQPSLLNGVPFLPPLSVSHSHISTGLPSTGTAATASPHLYTSSSSVFSPAVAQPQHLVGYTFPPQSPLPKPQPFSQQQQQQSPPNKQSTPLPQQHSPRNQQVQSSSFPFVTPIQQPTPFMQMTTPLGVPPAAPLSKAPAQQSFISGEEVAVLQQQQQQTGIVLQVAPVQGQWQHDAIGQWFVTQ